MQTAPKREDVMKKVFAGLALLVVLTAAALWFLVYSLDAVIEVAIERYGSEATGVPVAVGAVRISLRDGEGGIEDLVIGSPEGFRAASTFELGSIHIALDTKTLADDPVLVKEIRIEAPRATYEWGTRSSNLAVIQKNVKAFAARHGGGSARSAPETPSEEGRKFIIDNLIVRGGSVQVSAALVEGATKQAKLSDLHVKGIGRKQGGVTPAEIAVEILNVITSDAIRGAAGANLDALRGQAGRDAEDAVDKALDDALGEDSKSAKDALKGLFQR
jgi:hypothetical protein